jgi:drug/metabolite transporter (DMT)-like permease
MKKSKQTLIRHGWFLIALVAALLSAPNGTFIKIASDSLDSLTLNALRFGLIALITIPYIMYMYQRFNKKNFRYSIYMGICMTIAALSYSAAISLSQASYVSIIALSMPIVFIVYSILMTGEKVRARSFFGIALAVTGAFLVVAIPIIMSGGIASEFHPLATVFAVIDSLAFPLAIIFSRKANEHGLPIMASFGVSAIVVTIICLIGALVFVGPVGFAAAGSPDVAVAIVYSAIVVALVARMLNVASYERIGSVAVSGLSYVESLLAILIPIIALRESISIELILGGALILVGVYFVETVHHKRIHRHIRVMQHR